AARCGWLRANLDARAPVDAVHQPHPCEEAEEEADDCGSFVHDCSPKEGSMRRPRPLSCFESKVARHYGALAPSRRRWVAPARQPPSRQALRDVASRADKTRPEAEAAHPRGGR